MRPGAIRLVAAAVLLAFLSVPLLGADRGTAQQSSDTPDTVNLYFYREDELGVAIRERSRLVQDTSIYFAALVELFRGPADDELGAGLTTQIPDGVSLEGPVDVDAGIATVDLSAEFRGGSGVLQAAAPDVLARRMAQIVFTLTRFDEIQSVQVRIAGQPIDALDSDGATVFRPVTRDDYASITPIVSMETPTSGCAPPARCDSGSANTFEANVQYRITDARGTTVTAGFFSATSGNGIRELSMKRLRSR
ncbi:MAG: GerMN domain-containing protein [Thermomicrobiales bacterium]